MCAVQEVFDVGGARIATQHPLLYMRSGEKVASGELMDRARKYGDTVIGYLDHGLQGRFLLSKKEVIQYEDVMHLVVMVSDHPVST